MEINKISNYIFNLILFVIVIVSLVISHLDRVMFVEVLENIENKVITKVEKLSDKIDSTNNKIDVLSNDVKILLP